MIRYSTLTADHAATDDTRTRIVEFLFRHLGRFGDRREDIRKAIDYALDNDPGRGGFVLLAEDMEAQEDLVGAVVMNRTGMSGYIPDNILVYIATHEQYRGRGIGRVLMEHAIAVADGDIALHVEPDNPARRLYDRLGFTNKYLEMRLQRQ